MQAAPVASHWLRSYVPVCNLHTSCPYPVCTWLRAFVCTGLQSSFAPSIPDVCQQPDSALRLSVSIKYALQVRGDQSRPVTHVHVDTFKPAGCQVWGVWWLSAAVALHLSGPIGERTAIMVSGFCRLLASCLFSHVNTHLFVCVCACICVCVCKYVRWVYLCVFCTLSCLSYMQHVTCDICHAR